MPISDESRIWFAKDCKEVDRHNKRTWRVVLAGNWKPKIRFIKAHTIQEATKKAKAKYGIIRHVSFWKD